MDRVLNLNLITNKLFFTILRNEKVKVNRTEIYIPALCCVLVVIN